MSDAAGRPALVLVAAIADNGVIGRAGSLPWHLPEDLKHFRALTWGKTILMGRRTFASLGKPLPGRDNWVLSRDGAFRPAGARVFASLEEACAAAGAAELLVIGGAELYREALPLAARLEVTWVHTAVVGDTRFPELDLADWIEASRSEHLADARHQYAYSFASYRRKPA